jgi:hypothetical protein
VRQLLFLHALSITRMVSPIAQLLRS